MSEGGTRGDDVVERGADRLDELARKAEARGGVVGKLSDELAEDAAFLRKLKPSLVAARMKGNLAADGAPAQRRAPSGPQVRPSGEGAGRSPFVVLGAAFATGVVLAKLIDWRGHAHPRR